MQPERGAQEWAAQARKHNERLLPMHGGGWPRANCYALSGDIAPLPKKTWHVAKRVRARAGFERADLLFIHVAVVSPDELDAVVFPPAKPLRVPLVNGHLVNPVMPDLQCGDRMVPFDMVEQLLKVSAFRFADRELARC